MARRYTCVPDAANVEKGALLRLMYELENRVVAIYIYIELVRTTGSVIKCLHVVCIKRSVPDACLGNRFLNQLFVRYRS